MLHMGNTSSSRSHSDSDSDEDAPSSFMADVHRGVALAGVGGHNFSSSAAGLAMRHNSFYNVTQHVTDYDAINIFRLKQSDLRKLKYERRYIPGISRQGMRLRVSCPAAA